MIPYIIAFTISCFIVEIASAKFITSKIVRFFLSSLAVIVVSILAGLRDYTVGGEDTLGYGNFLFSGAVQSQELGDLSIYATDAYISGEQGYLLLNFLVSRLTDNAHWFYFLLSLLTSGLALTGIWLVRNYASATFMWLTYLCTFYVLSFNALRQSVSLSLALCCIALTIRKRYFWALLACAISMLFHTSGIVSFALFFALWFLMRDGKHFLRNTLITIVICAGILYGASYLLQPLADLLGYSNYLAPDARSGQELGGEVLYRLVPLFFGIPIMFTALNREQTMPKQNLTKSELDKSQNQTPGWLNLGSLLVLLLIEMILLPLRIISYPVYRVLLYFSCAKVMAYSYIVSFISSSRWVWNLGLIVFNSAYFYFVVIERNSGWYTSSLLGLY